jgi:DNA polymerase III subunit chi
VASTITFVEARGADKRIILCRWVEKFYEDRKRVLVVTDSTLAAQHLDQLLWTFAQGSFIPHRIVTRVGAGPIPEPVAITAGNLALPQFDVLIPDCAVDLDFMSHYPNALHFILVDDPAQRQESRVLWQTAKDRGIEVQHVPYRAGRA